MATVTLRNESEEETSTDEDDSDCEDSTDSENISRNQQGRNSPQPNRQEILELENLIHGVGTLKSKCSIVQFQAEINMAKKRAQSLIITKEQPQEKGPEVRDSFGILKFAKEYDAVMKVIHQSRDQLAAEFDAWSNTIKPEHKYTNTGQSRAMCLPK